MLPLAAAGIGAASNLAGSYLSSQAAKKNAENNMYMQVAFARHGLKWKVKDAQEAGIHPLYALGASTHSYNPVSVGDTSLGSGLAAAGQDISRGLMATRTPAEKVDAYTTQLRSLQLERAGLENTLLKTRIASQVAVNNQAGNPPSMPSQVPLDDPEKTKPFYQGDGPYIPNRNMSPATAAGDEYGEWVEDAHGGVRYLNDLGNQTSKGLGIHTWLRLAGEKLYRDYLQAKARNDYRGSSSWRGHF